MMVESSLSRHKQMTGHEVGSRSKIPLVNRVPLMLRGPNLLPPRAASYQSRIDIEPVYPERRG